jgi:hypothetical protein
MPDWLTIVIAVVGLLGTVLGVLGVSGYLGERAKHKAEVRNKQEDKTAAELQEAAEQRLHVTIRNAFKEEIAPVNKKLDDISVEIDNIKHDLADNTVGTVTILRDRMKAILDDCRDAGFATTSTKGNWHELYKTYASLGGNHFREYVDAWKHELDELPSNPPTKRGRRSTMAGTDMFKGELPIEVSMPLETKTDNNKK